MTSESLFPARTGPLRWRRMPMEEEAPEEYGYEKIRANLAESSCRDLRFRDLGVALDDLVLLYGDHRGHRGARELLAQEAGLSPDDALLTAGAAMALFVVHITKLGPGDHLVVARPNYATNLETPYAIGCDVSFLDLRFEDGFRVDVEAIERMMTSRTKLISLTTPHNPTGTEMDLATLRAAIRLAEKHGCHILIDETYRDMSRNAKLPIAAGLSDRAISVSSVSKTYGVPGIREGWILSADKVWMKQCLAAKEQIVLTGSMVDEALAFEVLKKRPALLPSILSHLDAQFDVLRTFMKREARLEWVEPTGGVTAFPRVRAHVPFHFETFQRALLDDGVFLGPGHWFGQPERFMRLGFGWPTRDELTYGLERISRALDACAR